MSTRLRWPRVALVATSASVTAVAALGGAGVIGAGDAVAVQQPAVSLQAAPAAQEPAEAAPPPRPRGGADADPEAANPEAAAALPRRSGSGRRVVFSEGRQRVWLVGAAGGVRRTYPVSGSVYDNLDPGSYEVYSRSARAWGIDDSGTMRYFVRFTQGENAAIGFHDIPVDDGRRVQGVDELGTATSHGCIRQRRSDARALWAFAPLGTSVVVTA